MPTKPPTHESRLNNRAANDRAYRRTRRVPVDTIDPRAFRSSTAWRKCRDTYMRWHPLCSDPYLYHSQDGVTVPSAHAHHRVPIHAAPELRLMWGNLEALCAACHSKREQEAAKKYS